jgi:hypothetical protein
MAALCQAVQTKDLGTRGHSERVLRGAVMTGREVGFLDEAPAAIMHGTAPGFPDNCSGVFQLPSRGRGGSTASVTPAPPARRPICSIPKIAGLRRLNDRIVLVHKFDVLEVSRVLAIVLVSRLLLARVWHIP